MSFPKTIVALDLGEFWTEAQDAETGYYEADELLFSCNEDGSPVQPDSQAYELMQEMARRYNAYPALLKASRGSSL